MWQLSLYLFFFFFSDEQQALKQFPSSDPAGESAAQEFRSERGSGFGSVSETCASCCLWDFAKRGGPQVVLWQLHLLSTTMAYAGHHYSRGKNKLYYWRLLKEKERKFCWFYKTKNLLFFFPQNITADMFPLYSRWLYLQCRVRMLKNSVVYLLCSCWIVKHFRYWGGIRVRLETGLV